LGARSNGDAAGRRGGWPAGHRRVLVRSLAGARPAALACVVLALLWSAAPGEAGRYDEPSVVAPLADDSLLLDAAVAGRRVVAVGQRGHVLVSEDQGASWRQVVVPTRVTLTAVHFPTPRHGWAVGHDAVVIHTADAGETWERQYADPDLQSPLLDVWFADPLRRFKAWKLAMDVVRIETMKVR